jgi:PKD repeat protein
VNGKTITWIAVGLLVLVACVSPVAATVYYIPDGSTIADSTAPYYTDGISTSMTWVSEEEIYVLDEPVYATPRTCGVSPFLNGTTWHGTDDIAAGNYYNDADFVCLLASGAAPVAAFSGSPTSGTEPLSVSFTDSSANTPTSWLWDFGDGNTTGDTDQNPVHLYESTGIYTVNLTATNAYGSDSELKSSYITVSATPTPTPTITPTPTPTPHGYGYDLPYRTYVKSEVNGSFTAPASSYYLLTAIGGGAGGQNSGLAGSGDNGGMGNAGSVESRLIYLSEGTGLTIAVGKGGSTQWGDGGNVGDGTALRLGDNGTSSGVWSGNTTLVLAEGGQGSSVYSSWYSWPPWIGYIPAYDDDDVPYSAGLYDDEGVMWYWNGQKRLEGSYVTPTQGRLSIKAGEYGLYIESNEECSAQGGYRTSGTTCYFWDEPSGGNGYGAGGAGGTAWGSLTHSATGAGGPGANGAVYIEYTNATDYFFLVAKDYETNEIPRGVNYSVTGPGGTQTFTNIDSELIIDYLNGADVQAGVYMVSALAPGYPAASTSFTYSLPGEEHIIYLNAGGEVTYWFPVTVKDATTGNAIADSELDVKAAGSPWYNSTSENGKFNITGKGSAGSIPLETGDTLILEGNATGYFRYGFALGVYEESNGITQFVPLLPDRYEPITGEFTAVASVYDDETTAGLSGVAVVLKKGSSSVASKTTGSAGSAVFTNLTAGDSYSATATKAGYSTITKTVSGGSGSVVYIEIPMSPEGVNPTVTPTATPTGDGGSEDLNEKGSTGLAALISFLCDYWWLIFLGLAVIYASKVVEAVRKALGI